MSGMKELGQEKQELQHRLDDALKHRQHLLTKTAQIQRAIEFLEHLEEESRGRLEAAEAKLAAVEKERDGLRRIIAQDSAELRALCEARDQARKEVDMEWDRTQAANLRAEQMEAEAWRKAYEAADSFEMQGAQSPEIVAMLKKKWQASSPAAQEPKSEMSAAVSHALAIAEMTVADCADHPDGMCPDNFHEKVLAVEVRRLSQPCASCAEAKRERDAHSEHCLCLPEIAAQKRRANAAEAELGSPASPAAWSAARSAASSAASSAAFEAMAKKLIELLIECKP